MALLFVIFTVLLFTVPVIQSHSCAPVNFEIPILTSVPFWWFETDLFCSSKDMHSESIDGLQHDIYNVTTPKCRFIFSVCEPLPILCPNQEVCKIKGMDSSFKFFSLPVNLGSIDYEGFSPKSGDNFFSIEYRNGAKQACISKSGPQPLRTLITFHCQKSTNWNSTNKKSLFVGGSEAPPAKIIFDMANCMYRISFNSSEGCPLIIPGEVTKRHTLSTGSILLILFFPSVFLYCVIGGLINGSRNKSGAQLIPNYDFWKEIPYLVLDGFGFVIAIITCSKPTTTHVQQNETSYQSM